MAGNKMREAQQIVLSCPWVSVSAIIKVDWISDGLGLEGLSPQIPEPFLDQIHVARHEGQGAERRLLWILK
jgi:hypothetical protein